MVDATGIDKASIAEIEKQLRYISAMIKETGRQMLIDYDINPLQFIALQWISDEDGMTIGELSQRMYLAFSTTTDLVDRMEDKELVERNKDQDDKRVVRIHLLPKGYETITSVITKRQEYLADHIHVLAKEERMGFEAGLDRLFKEIKKDL